METIRLSHLGFLPNSCKKNVYLGENCGGQKNDLFGREYDMPVVGSVLLVMGTYTKSSNLNNSGFVHI